MKPELNEALRHIYAGARDEALAELARLTAGSEEFGRTGGAHYEDLKSREIELQARIAAEYDALLTTLPE